GGPPNLAEQAQKIFDSVSSSAWTSRPMTGSKVAVLMTPPPTPGGSNIPPPAPRGGSYGRPPPVPLGRLLVRLPDAQHGLRVERAADHLEPDREAAPVEPARKRKRGQAGEVHRDREDVGEIHRHRIGRLLAQPERGGRRHRGHERVAGLERLLEVHA